MGVLTRDASFTRSNETAHPCCAEGSRNPMDGGYPSHIHHVSHVRNMRETCAKRAKCPARISRNVRETCAKRVRNVASALPDPAHTT